MLPANMFSVDLHCIILQTKNIVQKRLPQVTTRQTSDKDNEEDDILVGGRASIGLARGRAMQSRPSMVIYGYLV